MDNKAQEIKMVEIEKIIANPKNTNKHPEEQLQRLEKIIKYQGFREPLVVSNRSGFLVCGHGRLEVARRMNAERVPVIYQDFENEAQEFAHMTADNEIARWAKLDEELLKKELENLELPDLDNLGIADLSFLDPEVTKLDTVEEAPTEPPKIPVATRGDVWLLGDHRVMCGDSTAFNEVEKLINGNKVDMIFTDPPYNVAFKGRSGKHEVIKNDDLAEDDFNNFIEEVWQTILAINAPVIYMWCNWKFYAVLQNKIEWKNCIVWVKNNFGRGRNYRAQHEFCLFSGKLDDEIKNESDVWEIARETEKYQHPTQKPTALSERALGNHKDVKNVLDLFGGSGSTLLGCEKLKRKALVMELDEKYVDVIITRWQKLTGKKATLEGTDETFDDLAPKRLEEKSKA